VLPCLPGQEIDIEREGEILVCPWHGWEFDLATGCSLLDPERVRVRAYPARLEGGRVLVDMD
jgi:3-phenylpropionate/trans-cinnamate dioxygenase ferredoxin subunit